MHFYVLPVSSFARRSIHVLLVLAIAIHTLKVLTFVGFLQPSMGLSVKQTASTPVRSLPITFIGQSRSTSPSDWVVLLDKQLRPVQGLLIESAASVSVAATLRGHSDDLFTLPISPNKSEELLVRSMLARAEDNSQDVARAWMKLHMEIMDAADWIILIYHYNRRRLSSPVTLVQLAMALTSDLLQLGTAGPANLTMPFSQSESTLWAQTLVSNIDSIVLRADELITISEKSIEEIEDVLRYLRPHFNFTRAASHLSVLPSSDHLPGVDRSALVHNVQSVRMALRRTKAVTNRAHLLAESAIEVGRSLQQDMALALSQCPDVTLGWKGPISYDVVAQYVAASVDIVGIEFTRQYALNRIASSQVVLL